MNDITHLSDCTVQCPKGLPSKAITAHEGESREALLADIEAPLRFKVKLGHITRSKKRKVESEF